MVGPDAVGAKKPRPLLPNLQPLPAFKLIGPETNFMPTLGVDAPVIVDGCFTDERVRKGAARCLRYDGIVANYGRGPLELHYRPDAHTGLASAHQRIFWNNGTHKDRFATESEFHPTHAHFHVRDFYTARLWKASSRGRKIGSKPVALGHKNGFCPEDSAQAAAGPTSSTRYSCLQNSEEGSDLPTLQVVGISAGWMDVYPETLPDQFVEISGVPDGRYILEIELDPNNVFKESNEHDNFACTLLYLEGQGASASRAVRC